MTGGAVFSNVFDTVPELPHILSENKLVVVKPSRLRDVSDCESPCRRCAEIVRWQRNHIAEKFSKFYFASFHVIDAVRPVKDRPR